MGLMQTVPGRREIRGRKGHRIAMELRHAPAGTFAEEQRTHADMAMAGQVGDVLDRHYSGHLFFVEVDSHQGGCKIQIPTLMKQEDWFWIPLKMLNPHNVMLAGGEILRSVGLKAGAFDVDTYLEAREKFMERERTEYTIKKAAEFTKFLKDNNINPDEIVDARPAAG